VRLDAAQLLAASIDAVSKLRHRAAPSDHGGGARHEQRGGIAPPVGLEPGSGLDDKLSRGVGAQPADQLRSVGMRPAIR
jgi:hypothetical protein